MPKKPELKGNRRVVSEHEYSNWCGHQEYVYFIETEDRSYLKIGFSARPQHRFYQIQGANPQACRLLFCIKGGRNQERKLHERFRAARTANGEWFRITPEIRDFLDMLPLSMPEDEVPMRGKVKKKPIKQAKKRRAHKTVAYLTINEKDRLFGVIKDVRDKAIFRLLYHHGLRASEIGKLQMSDWRPGSKLEFDRMYLRRLKGSMSGEAALIPAAASAIRAWIRKRGQGEGALFPTRNRTPIGRNWIFKLMRRYCAAASIPAEKSHPHVLKHSCATHLVSDKRESIMDVKTHLGHAAIASTMVYAELTNEANEARAKRLREWR